MKINYLIFIAFLLSFLTYNTSFSQNEKFRSRSYSYIDGKYSGNFGIIAASCDSIDNWEAKNECSMKKLIRYVNKYLELEKLPSGKHTAKVYLLANTNGMVSEHKVISTNSLFKKRLVIIFNNLKEKYFLSDIKGLAPNTSYTFPVHVEIEK